ncbi:MAG: DsrE family protein [Candidatus Thiodiazotropha sp. (ex Myrtea spinifera)]|nr:DsrE family protein [Candidatus Thiodiazotropha sp. (ex Myrtea spinifera)]MCU7829318.1 DsrE family protein [Candidatus Thiodiazotropha sp. (ex Myrtea sp. 'scaly one' KF741663)]
MKITIPLILLFTLSNSVVAERAKEVLPDYQAPKVVYDFYLDDPAKLDSALYWIRALMNPLTESPYDMAPEFMDIKVVIHGTEIVTLVKKNYEKYRDQVERMRYYHTLGVEFKVCGLAAHDFGYVVDDFQPFIEIVPSAFTELVHWQQQGYALIVPQVFIRTQALEDIR